MIVYLIGFILTIILLYISEYKVKSKRKKFLLRVVAVLPLLVISAIRYNVGTDYDKRYVQDYINLSKGIEVTNLEIGFKAIDYMCLVFTKEPFLLFIITSTIILSIIFEVIYKKSINKILSIIIFFFGGYFFGTLNLVRQYVAVALVMLGYQFFTSDNKKKAYIGFIICAILAFLMHSSSIICFAILFLNRRGFATFIMCRDCGYTAKCKNCDITLTYHLKENKLKCHYCGYETKALTVCPECGGKNIRYFGTGTQKLEEQIKTMFPDATTIRMDIDTVTKKNSHEDILNSFKKDGIDILIGTQMVVKGHDFPNVTLVGVIAADSSLNIDDYRAHERTFQTLTQVAGRAGRGKDKGRVIIQTYNPDAFCIQYSQKQDYKLFYDTEIHLRKQLRYPPFCDIILIGVSSKSYKELEETSNKIYESLKAKIHTEKLQILLYKPVPAPIDRIKNKFRWRIIVKCIVGEPIINAIDDTVKNAGNKNTKNDTRIVVDVNPSNML